MGYPVSKVPVPWGVFSNFRNEHFASNYSLDQGTLTSKIFATRGCWRALGEPKYAALVCPTTTHTLTKIAGAQVISAVVHAWV